jgi:PmbA protein
MRNEAEELLELAHKILGLAKGKADVAEVSLGSSSDLSAKVRLGAVELVEEAGQRGASLRVIRNGRVATSSTSDLSAAGIQILVRDALELSELSEPDPFAGPAPRELIASPPFVDLDLVDPAIVNIDAQAAIDIARKAEAAALASDARIKLSEGATFGRSTSTRVVVLSGGFEGTTSGSYASLSVVPVAIDEGDKRRRGFYWTGKRHFADLEDFEAVGREAARRTLLKLGARKVQTGTAKVVFDADSARSILGTFGGTILGGALYRKASYLFDRVGTTVASPLVSIVDDPLIRRGPGSRPFDGEGLASRVNVVVRDGKLETYLLDCYAARKLGLTSTASAGRGGGSISSSTSNFIMRAGTTPAAKIIEDTERGLYVTEMMGFGFNGVTGDFSRGAAGFWIEDGKLAFPVSEVTISSNLDRMLQGIDLVGDDLDLKTAVAAPSFRVSEMTISGN